MFQSPGLDSGRPFQSPEAVDVLHSFGGEAGMIQLPQGIATRSIVRALGRTRTLTNAAWREIVRPKRLWDHEPEGPNELPFDLRNMKVVIIGCVAGQARYGCSRTSRRGRITRRLEAIG